MCDRTWSTERSADISSPSRTRGRPVDRAVGTLAAALTTLSVSSANRANRANTATAACAVPPKLRPKRRAQQRRHAAKVDTTLPPHDGTFHPGVDSAHAQAMSARFGPRHTWAVTTAVQAVGKGRMVPLSTQRRRHSASSSTVSSLATSPRMDAFPAPNALAALQFPLLGHAPPPHQPFRMTASSSDGNHNYGHSTNDYSIGAVCGGQRSDATFSSLPSMPSMPSLPATMSFVDSGTAQSSQQTLPHQTTAESTTHSPLMDDCGIGASSSCYPLPPPTAFLGGGACNDAIFGNAAEFPPAAFSATGGFDNGLSMLDDRSQRGVSYQPPTALSSTTGHHEHDQQQQQPQQSISSAGHHCDPFACAFPFDSVESGGMGSRPLHVRCSDHSLSSDDFSSPPASAALSAFPAPFAPAGGSDLAQQHHHQMQRVGSGEHASGHLRPSFAPATFPNGHIVARRRKSNSPSQGFMTLDRRDSYPPRIRTPTDQMTFGVPAQDGADSAAVFGAFPQRCDHLTASPDEDTYMLPPPRQDSQDEIDVVPFHQTAMPAHHQHQQQQQLRPSTVGGVPSQQLLPPTEGMRDAFGFPPRVDLGALHLAPTFR